jgi:hypothetical protein
MRQFIADKTAGFQRRAWRSGMAVLEGLDEETQLFDLLKKSDLGKKGIEQIKKVPVEHEAILRVRTWRAKKQT